MDPASKMPTIVQNIFDNQPESDRSLLFPAVTDAVIGHVSDGLDFVARIIHEGS